MDNNYNLCHLLLPGVKDCTLGGGVGDLGFLEGGGVGDLGLLEGSGVGDRGLCVGVEARGSGSGINLCMMHNKKINTTEIVGKA